ncbi:unnamed protein product [Rotaria sp. Silwood1]|nr:unnamed protein product [Rotaria sp. Silwood1]
MNSICIGIILIFLLVSTQSYTLPPSSTESPNNNDCVGTDCLSTESGEQVPVVELTTTGNTKDAYLCECSQESHETSRDKADDSSDECTNICTTALEMNQFQENSNLIHPNDIAALNYYRRAFDRYKEGNDTNFEKIQTRVRHHLLKTYGWEMADVERLLQWKWIPHDKNGFRLAGLPLKVPVPRNGKVYSTVGGISFHENGSFWFNLMEAKDKPALFNSDDVELVMKRGITSASFSLDPPLNSDIPHPFQKTTWIPHDALAGTDFLSTLLHADLWLKNMDVRMEMSDRFPFHIRPIHENSSSAPSSDLYQRLLKKDELKDDVVSSATRVWIQSGPIKYNRIEQDNITTYILGPPNMQVKYESYIRYYIKVGVKNHCFVSNLHYRQVKNNVTGLIDTYLGGSSPWHDHFTTILTDNYNEFGYYFPEFLRLGELSKLIGVALIFQHHYRKLREILSPASLDSVAKDLNTSNLRKQVFNGVWPLVTDVRVENALDRLILEQGFQLSNKHNIQNLGTARLHIREQLTKLQNNQIKKIAEAISTAFNISVHAISSTAIDTYLRNASADAENALLNEIVSGYS